MAEYVTCVICGKYIAGKVPKGGDGSVLFPRKHEPLYLTAEEIRAGQKSVKPGSVCPGSYQEAVEYVNSR